MRRWGRFLRTGRGRTAGGRTAGGRKGGVRLAGVVLAAGLATVLAAGPAWAASVNVADFRFSPGTVTIKAGESVTWSSSGPSPHTVTADDQSFDSGTLNPGQSFSHTFSTPGTYHYHCQFHVAQGMVGTVVVQAATTTPPPSPTSSPTPSGEPSPTSTPLPNTGLGTGWLVGGMAGLGLVIAGAVVLFGVRRRNA